MKGAAHFHSLAAQDNLVLKRAQSVSKLVSEVSTEESYPSVLSPFSSQTVSAAALFKNNAAGCGTYL